MPSLKTTNRMRSGITLLAASQLGARVIKKIAGNEISTSINGNTASSQVIQTLLLQRITNRLLERKNNLIN